jgi:hypothetical protein
MREKRSPTPFLSLVEGAIRPAAGLFFGENNLAFVMLHGRRAIEVFG